MTSAGSVFKQCGCTHTVGGRRRCPQLEERAHGRWYFSCTAPNLSGRRGRVRRGGYTTRAAAERALRAALDQPCDEMTGQPWTVGRWLTHWLATRRSLRPGTLRTYESAIRIHLIPHLGSVRLTDLTSRHIATMFREMEQATNRRGVPYSLSGLQAIRATLRSALSAAIREDLIAANPASRVELSGPRRPHPVVWRAPRVAAWRATGVRPPVAVWTVAQLAAFLRGIETDPLYALWWLIALRGLRRGEAVGLPWANVDLDRGELTITQQITADDPDGAVSAPKSRASNRLVALDKHTVQVLRDHARRQRAAALAAGPGWLDTGYVFTRADGRPLRPDSVTHTFARLIDLADLPPVRLHDLRHGAASLAHAAGADLKTIQDQLGHASIILTADTYTTVLAAAQRQAAAATARIVLTTARLTSERIRHQHKRRTLGNSQATDQDQKSAGTRPTKAPRPAETPARRRGNTAKSGQHRGNHRRHRTHR